MRVRDAVACGVAMLGFVPVVMGQENTPNQDQPRPPAAAGQDNPTDQQKGQPQTDQAKNAAAQVTPETKQLDSHMAQCLNMCNHAEVELAKMALDKSQNQQVRALAQKIHDDHSAAHDDLKRFISHDATADKNAEKNADQATENANDQAGDRNHAQHGNYASMEALAKKIAKNELAMTKDVLMRYEGQDFDMGYLGQQIIAHTQMLAKLHAMKDQGSEAFQLSVANMIGTAEDHFKDATRLSRQLQGREGDTGEASPTSANETRGERRAFSAETQNNPAPANNNNAPQNDDKPKNQDRVGNPQDEK